MVRTINRSQERLGTDAEITPQECAAIVGGSQSSGAGAGKVTFNPFSITRKIDVSSPMTWLD